MSNQGPVTAARPLRVLGIDPGSRVTGFGVVDRPGRQSARATTAPGAASGKATHVAHGTIRVPTHAGDLANGLAHVFAEVSGVIERYAPDVACVEQVFVSVNARSALILGQARGAALVALARAGVTVVEYTPAEIKQSVTGNGRAPKDQVQRLVTRLLDLEKVPAQDAADALAAALCHAGAGALAGLPRVPTSRQRRSRGSGLRVRRSP